MTLISRLISTGLGVGYFPIAPGTMGTLAAVVVFWFCPQVSIFQLILICLGLTAIGIYSASITEKEMQNKAGSDELHDPGIIVIDEIVGMFVALIAIPKTLNFVIAAFILFRIFDIAKPFPIKKIEKLPSGWGIILDDVAAGLFANIILQIVIIIFHL